MPTIGDLLGVTPGAPPWRLPVPVRELLAGLLHRERVHGVRSTARAARRLGELLAAATLPAAPRGPPAVT